MLQLVTFLLVLLSVLDTNAEFGLASFQRGGVRGAKGDKGERGPPGPPGVCVCDTDKKSSSDKKKESEYNVKADISSKIDTQGDAGLKTESIVKSDGYYDTELASGTSLNENGVGLNKKYNKGNFKESTGVDAFETVSEFERTEQRDSDGREADFQVDYTENISKRAKESIGDEGHSGTYKGTEFDVSNRLRDKEGNMVERSMDKDVKESRYGNIEASGNNFAEGKYNDELFNKYGNDDENLKSKKEYGYDDYKPENGLKGDGNDEYNDDLYGRYKGNSRNDNGNKYEPRYDNRNARGKGKLKRKETKESSKDGKYESFGNNFNDRLKFDEGKMVATEQGSRIKANERGTFNREKFRDIDNKGHNKLAQYKGDYNKRDKFHNVDKKADVDISLDQDSTFAGGFIDGKFVADQNLDFVISEKSKVAGKKTQSGYDSFNKYDDLKEKEYLLKNDAKVYNDKYKKLDKSKDTKVKKEDDIYFKAKRDTERGGKKEFNAKRNEGNGRSRARNYYRPNDYNKDNKFGSPRQRGYRQRGLLGINNDVYSDVLSVQNDLKRLYMVVMFIAVLFVAQTTFVVMLFYNKQYK